MFGARLNRKKEEGGERERRSFYERTGKKSRGGDPRKFRHFDLESATDGARVIRKCVSSGKVSRTLTTFGIIRVPPMLLVRFLRGCLESGKFIKRLLNRGRLATHTEVGPRLNATYHSYIGILSAVAERRGQGARATLVVMSVLPVVDCAVNTDSPHTCRVAIAIAVVLFPAVAGSPHVNVT